MEDCKGVGKGVSAKKRKLCPSCDGLFPVKMFSKDRCAKDGRQTYCKACQSLRHRVHRKTHRRKALARERAWRTANREKVRAISRKYRERHPNYNRAQALWKYGLDLEWFNARLRQNNRSCERCLTPFKNLSTDCQVDHDHRHCFDCDQGGRSCGSLDAIRGLLCARCNSLLRRNVTAADDSYVAAYHDRLERERAA